MVGYHKGEKVFTTHVLYQKAEEEYREARRHQAKEASIEYRQKAFSEIKKDWSGYKVIALTYSRESGDARKRARRNDSNHTKNAFDS